MTNKQGLATHIRAAAKLIGKDDNWILTLVARGCEALEPTSEGREIENWIGGVIVGATMVSGFDKAMDCAEYILSD